MHLEARRKITGTEEYALQVRTHMTSKTAQPTLFQSNNLLYCIHAQELRRQHLISVCHA